MLYFYYIANIYIQNYKLKILKYILDKTGEFASINITLNQIDVQH